MDKIYNFATGAFYGGDLLKQLQKIADDNGYKMPCFATFNQIAKLTAWRVFKGQHGHQIEITKKNGIVLKFKVFNLEQCEYAINFCESDSWRHDKFEDVKIPLPAGADADFINEIKTISYNRLWHNKGHAKTGKRKGGVMCDCVLDEAPEKAIKIDIEAVKWRRQMAAEERKQNDIEHAAALGVNEPNKQYFGGMIACNVTSNIIDDCPF